MDSYLIESENYYREVPAMCTDVISVVQKIRELEVELEIAKTDLAIARAESDLLRNKNKELENKAKSFVVPDPEKFSAAMYNNAIDAMKNDKYATWFNNSLTTTKTYTQRELAEGSVVKYNQNITYYVPGHHSEPETKKAFVSELTKSAVCEVLLKSKSRATELSNFRRTLKSVGIIMSDSELSNVVAEVSGFAIVKFEIAVVIH